MDAITLQLDSNENWILHKLRIEAMPKTFPFEYTRQRPKLVE